jgi:response regulator NasT
VQPIIDVAMARFREFQALKDELDATRNQLSERKVVEKAKVLLMRRKDISEDEAYQADPSSKSNAGKSYVVFGKQDTKV